MLFASLFTTFAHAESQATALIKRAESHTRGKTFQGELTMTVNRSGQSRQLKMKLWSEGLDKAMVKIFEPKKDRDTGNLRLKFDIWEFIPDIEKLIKIPSSMMLQSWMGSDFTNDDLVKSSSLSRDYDHEIEGQELLNGVKVIKIVCHPKPNAPVVWGKLRIWVRATDAAPLKQEFYDEKNELIKVFEGSQIQLLGSHAFSMHVLMKNLKKADSSTTIDYKNVIFDQAILASTFTQEFLRRPVQH